MPAKDRTPKDQGEVTNFFEERRVKALEQIAAALGQIHHELIQLRVQATNINVSLARKR
jgi:hypothetical protein